MVFENAYLMVILKFVIQYFLMEHFVVSARKYRPQTFKDVVGNKLLLTLCLMPLKTII